MGPKSEYLKSHKFDQQVTISVKYLALLFDILFKSLWPNCVGFYQYRAHRDYHLNPGFLEYGPLFIPYSELSAVCSLTMYLSKVWGLAIWVVKFPREGYKIRYIVGQKSTLLQGNYCIKRKKNNRRYSLLSSRTAPNGLFRRLCQSPISMLLCMS